LKIVEWGYFFANGRSSVDIVRSPRPAIVITSRQHDIVRVYRRAARGDATTPALIDGWHLLSEAVSAAIPLVEVAVVAAPIPPASQALLDEAARRGARLVSVSPSVMGALSPVRAPSGVVALVRRRDVDWPSLLLGRPALIVVAVGLQDPGNAGALVRAAEAGGATGVVLAADAADPWGWKALRAAMGSTFRLPVIREPDALAACRRLRDAGLQLVATSPRGEEDAYVLDLRPPTAVILGGEGGGLDSDILSAADRCVSIPMRKPVESLNVAVAGALLVYEAARQRRDCPRETSVTNPRDERPVTNHRDEPS
jgi:RNA methyltransferase, TrmH family